MNVLEVNNVFKIYRSTKKNKSTDKSSPSTSAFTAVDSLSFSVKAGESVAFLGPNGAGKSTTIKMLCGILKPTSGHCKVMGHESGSVEANSQIGLVFGARSQLWFHLPVDKAIMLCGSIYGVPKSALSSRLKELSQSFSIEHLLERRVRSLSLGERMRCEIVAALMHRPKILLADEPTVGLDIVSRLNLRRVLSQWQKHEGTTLLLTSHDLADVESLCTRAIFVNHGRIVYDGALNGLGKNRVKKVITIAFDPALEQSIWLQKDMTLLSKAEGKHCYGLSQGGDLGPALQGLVSHYGSALADMKVEDPSLEMAVVELMGSTPRPHGVEHA